MANTRTSMNKLKEHKQAIILPTSFHNIERLKAIAEKMLVLLESVTDSEFNIDSKECEALFRQSQIWFGTRASLFSVLASLTELILTLEHMGNPHSELQVIEDDALSEKDISILRNFVMALSN